MSPAESWLRSSKRTGLIDRQTSATLSHVASAVAALAIPRDSSRYVQSAVLRIISLAHFVIVCTRARAVLRLAGENDRLEQELSLLREALRIKDARLERVPLNDGPLYAAAAHGNPGTASGAGLAPCANRLSVSRRSRDDRRLPAKGLEP